MTNAFLTILATLATSSISTVLFRTHSRILIFELDFIFLDVLGSEMLFSLMTLELVLGEPRVYQWLLNIDGAHLLLA